MSTEATFFIDGQFMGRFDPGFDIRGLPRTGIAYWCPHCAATWAMLIIPDQLTYPRCIPCRKHHSSPYLPGGSIWLPLEDDLNKRFPKETLIHEFLRCCELIEQHPEEFQVPQ